MKPRTLSIVVAVGTLAVLFTCGQLAFWFVVLFWYVNGSHPSS